MAINDSAVITPAVGYIFFAPPGTAAPTPAVIAGLDVSRFGADESVEELDDDGKPVITPIGKAALPAAWVNVGHSSRDSLPEFGYDGGDTEVKGTWQNESLREVETKPVADFLTMALHQFDSDTLKLYYGADTTVTAGVLSVPGGTTKPVEKALVIVIVDGDTKIGFHASKVSVKRDDSISLKVDEFAGIPLKATFLKSGTAPKYSWINKDLFV